MQEVFHQVRGQEDKINTMARYKKYRYGGKKVPGMYAQDGVETNPVPPQRQSLNERPMIQAKGSGRAKFQEMNTQGLTPQQIQMMKMQAMQEQQKMQQQMQMKEMMMQMKMQNDNLLQQNELLKTQIQKSDLINSARTTKKPTGAVKSPKKYGGGNKKRVVGFTEAGSGNMMKHGGSCLPGGAYSRRKR